MVKGVLISRKENGVLSVVAHTIDKEDGFYLSALYRAIGCDTVEVVERKIAGNWYDLWCDENALLTGKQDVTVITIDQTGTPVEKIVGNVFVAGAQDGEMKSIPDEEIARIQKEILPEWDKKRKVFIERVLARV